MTDTACDTAEGAPLHTVLSNSVLFANSAATEVRSGNWTLELRTLVACVAGDNCYGSVMSKQPEN